MIAPGFRRDRTPGPVGFVNAVVTPLLVVALVTAIGYWAYQNKTNSQLVLLFGINAIMVIGFQLFTGSTGIVSFGHVAFMAVGAYASAVVSIDPKDKDYLLPHLPRFLHDAHLGIVPALLVGGAAAAVLALISGVALMRLSGSAASIATLGLLVITVNVLQNANRFTAGPRSLFGVPEDASFNWVFIWLAIVVLVSGLYKWSSFGLRSRANRDDLVASETLGVGSLRARLPPFVISAFITGIGGGLYGMLLTAFSPMSFTIALAVVVLTMAIVGGVNSITGALVGAALVTLLNETMRRVESGVHIFGVHVQAATGISAAVLGVALIVTLRLRPEGLFSAYELQFLQRQREPVAETAPTQTEGGETPASSGV